SSTTGTISSVIKSLHCRPSSVNAAGSSLSSRSYPWLKSARVHRPRSFTPLGGASLHESGDGFVAFIRFQRKGQHEFHGLPPLLRVSWLEQCIQLHYCPNL